jgi:phosphoglycerate dehydrogenase-like enzyme
VTTYRGLITSPLEQEHVERIRRSMPANVELVCEPEFFPPTRYVADHNGPADFTRPPEQEQRWRELIASADILFDFPKIAGHPHTYAPKLRWVQTTSAGVGQAVARMGIRQGEIIVTTSSGVHARPLAEFVFMALLMHAKLLPRITADQRARRWERFCSDELSGKVLAIVGPGKIGREIARIARTFDMLPVALARDSRPHRAAELGVERVYDRASLHEMLSAADAVVLCAPHTPETDGMLDRSALDAMKPGAVFVNIARGQLVDETALLDKLADGTIAFAALDVFRTEPLPPDSPFWDLPNVLINPHSASTSDRENGRISDIFIHNLHCFVDGRLDQMRNVLDIERMY